MNTIQVVGYCTLLYKFSIQQNCRTLFSELHCVIIKVALVDFTSVLSFSTGHLNFKFSMTAKMLQEFQ